MRAELYAYLATVLKNQTESEVVLINGVADHVHILFGLSRKHALMDVVRLAKTESAKWLKHRDTGMRDFAWQSGYGVFSVSQSNLQRVRDYVANQEVHHRRFTFQDELRTLCEKHGLELNERYAWD